MPEPVVRSAGRTRLGGSIAFHHPYHAATGVVVDSCGDRITALDSDWQVANVVFIRDNVVWLGAIHCQRREPFHDIAVAIVLDLRYRQTRAILAPDGVEAVARVVAVFRGKVTACLTLSCRGYRSATLLAKRWESVLLVNVDDATLGRLMKDEAAMKALMSIEGFRNLNAELETIINRSEQIKDTKKKAGEGEELTPKEKKELTEAEKERKSLRKQVQEKLIKFAARVPVFMYLTDYRERCLKDVITKIEPRLFQKVTGLTTADFERLVSLGVFNSALMNDAVWKFRRYEDASLRYMGVERHRPLELGLWDTELTEDDFQETFEGIRPNA